jgi:hypothetical protein
MSRGLTDPLPEQNDADQDAPTVQELDQAMQVAYQNVYDLSVRVDTLERILANLLPKPEQHLKPETKKKRIKGL